MERSLTKHPLSLEPRFDRLKVWADLMDPVNTGRNVNCMLRFSLFYTYTVHVYMFACRYICRCMCMFKVCGIHCDLKVILLSGTLLCVATLLIQDGTHTWWASDRPSLTKAWHADSVYLFETPKQAFPSSRSSPIFVHRQVVHRVN
jgi:hypothetical protein